MTAQEIAEYPESGRRHQGVTNATKPACGPPTATALAKLLAALSASCSYAPQPPPATDVLIQNPTGGVVYLHEASRDSWRSTRPLGDARALRLKLPVGRFALSHDAGRPLQPLPVLPAELGYAPRELTVTVTPPPAARGGWCWIPAGPFVHGDRLGVGQEDERPVRTPRTPGFWLAEHETTNAQYAQFLNAISPEQIDPGWLDFGGPKCRIRRDVASGDFQTDDPDHPVVTVSAAGADAYCRWRTDVRGVQHRLPSEAEWEKAARGPGSRVYAYGDTCTTLRANQESGALMPVGRYPPNGFGLHDMTGNAFEWTADVYVSGRANDPDSGAFRALRGGSFLLDGIFVRNAMRMRLRPSVRADDVGFRVLRKHDDMASSNI